MRLALNAMAASHVSGLGRAPRQSVTSVEFLQQQRYKIKGRLAERKGLARFWPCYALQQHLRCSRFCNVDGGERPAWDRTWIKTLILDAADRRRHHNQKGLGHPCASLRGVTLGTVVSRVLLGCRARPLSLTAQSSVCLLIHRLRDCR